MMKTGRRNKRCILYFFVIFLIIGLFAFSSNAFAWVNIQIGTGSGTGGGGTGGGGTGGGGTGGGGTGGGGTGGGGTGGGGTGSGPGGSGGGTGSNGIFYMLADGISQVPMTVTVINPGDPSANPPIAPYPMAGLTVIFSITSGEGSLSVLTTTTDPQGEALTIFTVGTTPGMITIQVSIPDIGQSACYSLCAFTAEIKAENGISEPAGYIAVGDTNNFKAKILPVGLTGNFNWEITSGQQYAQITAGADSQTVSVKGIEASQNIDDVTLQLEFDPTGTVGWFNTDAHKFTIVGVDKIKITPDKAEVPVSETQDFTANPIWFGPDGLEGTTDDKDVTQYFTIQWSTEGSALENIGTVNPLTGTTTTFTARAELPVGKSKLAGRVIASAGGIRGIANVSVIAVAKLSYIEAVDANNKSRNSIDKLQMVSENNGERNAVITAYKDNIKLTWKEEEPIWSGFINTEGIDSVTIKTNQSGTESAQAGNITKTVNIDIFPTDEQEFTFAGKNVINEISIFSEKLASTFNLSTGPSSPLSISASWKWVDKYKNPLVARNVIVKLTGKTSRFKVKALVPGYGISFPLIDVGLFLTADVGAEATLSYNYDPSQTPANICTIKGAVTVDSSIGAEYKVETYGLLYKIYGGVKFEIPATITATFIDTAPENPGLSSTGSVGPSTVQIKVKIQSGETKWKKVFEPWEVMPKIILWEYPKKLGG